MKQLLIFRRFSDDPQGVLAAVHRIAFVGIKLCLNIRSLELSIASFTNAKGRALFYDSQFTLHNFSLSHSAGRT